MNPSVEFTRPSHLPDPFEFTAFPAGAIYPAGHLQAARRAGPGFQVRQFIEAWNDAVVCPDAVDG